MHSVNNNVKLVAICGMQCACAILSTCGLFGCTMFIHIISQMARFSGKNVVEYKMCFHFIYKFCLKISHSIKNLATYRKCE